MIWQQELMEAVVRFWSGTAGRPVAPSLGCMAGALSCTQYGVESSVLTFSSNVAAATLEVEPVGAIVGHGRAPGHSSSGAPGTTPTPLPHCENPFLFHLNCFLTISSLPRLQLGHQEGMSRHALYSSTQDIL